LKTPAPLVLLAAALSLTASLALAQSKQGGQKLYRWVDAKGLVHYGDHVPPEYADRDREVLNSQGVPVGFEQGEISRSETAAADKKKQEDEAAQQAREEAANHDRMLLETYLTVGDIEELRDRRLELLDSRIKVTEAYLANLRTRLDKLQSEAARYTSPPGGKEPRAVPDDLAEEIAKTSANIDSYQSLLEHTRSDQTKLRQSFDADIARFKELKGG
jgi:hypothetical protein